MKLYYIFTPGEKSCTAQWLTPDEAREHENAGYILHEIGTLSEFFTV